MEECKMVQVIERKQSLGEALGSGLGAGINTGLSAALARHQQMNTPMTQYQQTQTALRAKELEQQAGKENERVSEWEHKANEAFKKDLVEGYNDSLMLETRLKRMKELNEKGNLSSPATAALLEKVGLPLGVLNNPDSEEFDKLSKDLLKGMSTYFPGRINIVEVENFLKTIPSLMNSREGRARVIDNLLALSEPKKMMYSAYKDLKKEGKLPLDLREAVIDRVAPQLEELSGRFKEGITNPQQQPTQQTANNVSPVPTAKRYVNPKTGQIIEQTETGWRIVQ
jgi:hypothetical protein